MRLIGLIGLAGLGAAAGSLPAQIPSVIEVRVPKPPTAVRGGIPLQNELIRFPR